jgi:hypothetical protein
MERVQALNPNSQTQVVVSFINDHLDQPLTTALVALKTKVSRNVVNQVVSIIERHGYKGLERHETGTKHITMIFKRAIDPELAVRRSQSRGSANQEMIELLAQAERRIMACENLNKHLSERVSHLEEYFRMHDPAFAAALVKLKEAVARKSCG